MAETKGVAMGGTFPVNRYVAGVGTIWRRNLGKGRKRSHHCRHALRIRILSLAEHLDYPLLLVLTRDSGSA